MFRASKRSICPHLETAEAKDETSAIVVRRGVANGDDISVGSC
jgi:hypothetical protein